MHPEASPIFPMQRSSDTSIKDSQNLLDDQEPFSLTLSTGAVDIAPDEAFSSWKLNLDSNSFFSRLLSVEFAQNYLYTLIMYTLISAS